MAPRHRLLIAGVLAAGLLTAPPATGASPPVPPACVFESPCVYVTPDVDPERARPGTVLTFRGRGWRPRARVGASYGSYCPPVRDTICAGVGLGTQFRADRKGRFVFRFRFGRRPPRGVRGPVGAGSEEVRFAGRTPRGGEVLRLAAPPPPPSTPQERAQAAGVRDAVRALERDVERASARTARTNAAQQRDVGRCQEIIRIKRPRRRAAIIDRVVTASLDASTYGEAGPEFEAFARRLEELGLTDPVLAAGAAAWTREIRAPRYRPEPGLCAVLERWRDTGFDPDAEPPVDLASTGFQETVRAARAIAAAARRLRDLGVRRDVGDTFAGDILGLERYISF